MRVAWTVARREVWSFFISPVAYVLLLVWLLFSGITFYYLVVIFSSQPMGASATASPLSLFFGGTTLFYLPLFLFAPIMTMRLLAEERSSGTLEPLLTVPVSEVSLVIGKYLAAMCFWAVLWLPTLVYVWIAGSAGQGVLDPGTLGATYLGIACIGFFYMAVGLLMSAVSRNQIVAATLTFLVLAGIFLLGLGGYVFTDEEARGIFEYVGIWSQMEAFSKGIVDTRYLVYDLSLALLGVFLSVRAVQANRWQ
jgi:ABC-2 type transport system permease protein